MRNIQQKSRFIQILHNRVVLSILFVLLLFFAWGVIGFMVKMNTVRENRALAEKKFIELEQKKIELSAQIDRLNTTEGVEETIRDKFGLVKEGEGLVVVVDEKNPPKAEEKPSNGFMMFFKNLFK